MWWPKIWPCAQKPNCFFIIRRTPIWGSKVMPPPCKLQFLLLRTWVNTDEKCVRSQNKTKTPSLELYNSCRRSLLELAHFPKFCSSNMPEEDDVLISGWNNCTQINQKKSFWLSLSWMWLWRLTSNRSSIVTDFPWEFCFDWEQAVALSDYGAL